MLHDDAERRRMISGIELMLEMKTEIGTRIDALVEYLGRVASPDEYDKRKRSMEQTEKDLYLLLDAYAAAFCLSDALGDQVRLLATQVASRGQMEDLLAAARLADILSETTNKTLEKWKMRSEHIAYTNGVPGAKPQEKRG